MIKVYTGMYVYKNSFIKFLDFHIDWWWEFKCSDSIVNNTS